MGDGLLSLSAIADRDIMCSASSSVWRCQVLVSYVEDEELMVDLTSIETGRQVNNNESSQQHQDECATNEPIRERTMTRIVK